MAVLRTCWYLATVDRHALIGGTGAVLKHSGRDVHRLPVKAALVSGSASQVELLLMTHCPDWLVENWKRRRLDDIYV